MVLLKIAFAFLLLGTMHHSSLGLQQDCPPDSVIKPCVCKKFILGPLLHCEGIQDQTGEQLRRAILAVSEYQVPQMYLVNSNFGTVPDNLLQGSSIAFILIRNVTFDTLDPFGMVSGNKDTVFALHCLNVFANNWQFSTRANDFRSFNSLIFAYQKKNAASPTLPEDFLTFLPERLTAIKLENLEIGTVPEPGFSQFTNITFVLLPGNRLREINRQVFPKPATNLHHLDLRNNSLTSLPEDIFEEMPSMSYLRLDFNHFTQFDENTFAPIWNKLRLVQLQDNPLHCGCEAAWLLQKERRPLAITLPTCASPPQFKGRSLESLSVKDLCPSAST